MNLNFQAQGIAAGLHSQQQASTILLMQCPLNMDVGIQKQFKDALHAVFTAYIMALHMKMIKDGVPPDEQPIVWHYTWTWSRMGWWADYIHEHDQGCGTTWWADYIMALHMNMIKDGVPPDEQTVDLWICVLKPLLPMFLAHAFMCISEDKMLVRESWNLAVLQRRLPAWGCEVGLCRSRSGRP